MRWGWYVSDSGMRVVRTEVQKGFPRDLGLFPVRAWALQPREWRDGEV